MSSPDSSSFPRSCRRRARAAAVGGPEVPGRSAGLGQQRPQDAVRTRVRRRPGPCSCRSVRRKSSRLTPPRASAGSQASDALSATAAAAAPHGTPRAANATTSAASRGLAPLGPGIAPASWLAPKAPRAAIGDRLCPVAATVPSSRPAIESWYPSESTSPCASWRGLGSGRLGSRLGRRRRTTSTVRTAPAPTAAATTSMRVGRLVPAKATKAIRPMAPTKRSAPTLSTASPCPMPVPCRRVMRQMSAPTWPGVSRPISSDSA